MNYYLALKGNKYYLFVKNMDKFWKYMLTERKVSKNDNTKGREKWEVTANIYMGFFWRWWKHSKIRLRWWFHNSEYIKNHCIIRFQRMNFLVRELYFNNKVVKNKKPSCSFSLTIYLFIHVLNYYPHFIKQNFKI